MITMYLLLLYVIIAVLLSNHLLTTTTTNDHSLTHSLITGTSIGLVPSGRLAVAGFTDGTLRLFDLTGVFGKDKFHPANNITSNSSTTTVTSKKKKNKKIMAENILFDDNNSNDDDDDDEYTYDDNDDNNNNIDVSYNNMDNNTIMKQKKKKVVNSYYSNQRYGAVACQIHARGVHTSLLMDVAVSEDGLYAFGGVQRGSVELAAVYLGDVEAYLDEQQLVAVHQQQQQHQKQQQKQQLSTLQPTTVGLLDLIQVDRHADAKLKGFGACTRLWNGWDRAHDANERPEYLLCTGKGIKNIHIWSYTPSRLARDEDAIWCCLYDTQTNGTSINQLYFRHNGVGTLQAISKSDDQKLRVWDLKYEQNRIARNSSGTTKSNDGSDDSDRPKRPDYVDVASTMGTVGVIGPYAFASGSLGGMHNIINVVGLDVDDVSSPFNSSELLLPLSDSPPAAVTTTSRTGRQQRGDLKSVEHVAGLVFDASHALLQLSDGSVVHYLHDDSGHPSLLPCPPSLCTTSIDDDSSPPHYGIVSPATGLNNKRIISLARVGSQAMVLLAVSSFNENTSRGAIMLRALPGSSGIINSGSGSKSFRRYWGFNGLKKKRKKQQQQIMAVVHSPLGTPIGGLGTTDSTPVNMVGKVMNSMRHVTPVDTSPFPSSRLKASPLQEGQNNTPPVHLPKGFSKFKKISPDADNSLVALEVEVVKHIRSNSKSRHDNDDRMDSQLEVIGQGTSISPMPVQKHTMTKSSKLLSDGTPKKKKQKTDDGGGGGGKETIHQDLQETPTSSSPKRRARFKSPESSLDNNLPPCDLTTYGSNSTVVGFTGMTVFDRKKDVQLPESCFQPKQRPVLLVEQLPMSTLASRLATPIDLTVVDVTTSVTEGGVHFQRHCNERRQLAAKHRAEHELIRKKVLHSIRYVLSTWDIELMSNKPHVTIVESAKTWFNDALECHQEMLDDMLGRQVMESESLAARQTSDLVTGHALVVQVSFPFPEVFEQARHEMIALIQ